MKVHLKTVAVISGVALVCVALLAVLNKFWAVENIVDDSELFARLSAAVGDDTVTTFEELEYTYTPADADLPQEIQAVYRAANGGLAGVVVLRAYAESKEGYGKVSLLVAIKADRSAIVNAVIYEVEYPKPARGAELLGQGGDVVDIFSGKTASDVTADLLKVSVGSTATDSASAFVAAATIAFSHFQEEYEAISSAPVIRTIVGEAGTVIEDSDELKMAKAFFPEAASLENEDVTEDGLSSAAFKILNVKISNTKIYKIYGLSVPYSYDDQEEGENPALTVYAGVNTTAGIWSGVKVTSISGGYPGNTSAYAELFSADKSRTFERLPDDFAGGLPGFNGSDATGTHEGFLAALNRIVELAAYPEVVKYARAFFGEAAEDILGDKVELDGLSDEDFSSWTITLNDGTTGTIYWIEQSYTYDDTDNPGGDTLEIFVGRKGEFWSGLVVSYVSGNDGALPAFIAKFDAVSGLQFGHVDASNWVVDDKPIGTQVGTHVTGTHIGVIDAVNAIVDRITGN